MEIISVPFQHLNTGKQVTVKTCGNIVSIGYVEKRNTTQNIKKLSKDFYIKMSDCYVDDDGDMCCDEIYEFNHNQTKADNIKYLRHICNNFRDMINSNVVNNDSAVFITLTYRQRDNPDDEPVPMRDTSRLQKDLEKFVKSMRYHFGKSMRYLTACEPQRTGSWHAHMLCCFDGKAPFISNADISRYWGQGFTFIQRIDNSVDNVGAYLTAYLTDMEVDDTSPVGTVKEVKQGDKTVKKKFVKGMRLSYYPLYFHPFRWSRNCYKPVVLRTSYKKAREFVYGVSPSFVKSYDIIVGDYTNRMQYEFYNLSKKKVNCVSV